MSVLHPRGNGDKFIYTLTIRWITHIQRIVSVLNTVKSLPKGD